MAKRSIQTTSQSLPASSWPVTFGGTVNIIVKRGASDENRKLNSGFLRGLGYFNLKAIGNGLGAGVGVDDFAEWVAFNAILVDPAPVDLVQRHRTEIMQLLTPAPHRDNQVRRLKQCQVLVWTLSAVSCRAVHTIESTSARYSCATHRATFDGFRQPKL